jgi:hypothetical protein
MSFAQIATPGLIRGIGLPCFFIPLTAATLSRVPDDKLAAASSLSNFLRTLAAAFGSALSVTLWDSRAVHHYGVLAASVEHASANTARYLQALQQGGVPGGQQLGRLHDVVQQQAYMMATNDVYALAAVTCAALAALIWLARPRRGAAASFGH